MDIGFHAVSAVWLAHRLGERRRGQLALAALIGISPDLVTQFGRMLGWRTAYPWTHSLAFNIPLLLLFLWFNRRIAWGGLLHAGMDVITHTYATRYLFYPFARVFIPIGITWYRWPGWLLWGALWGILLCLIFFSLKSARGSTGTTSSGSDGHVSAGN